MYTNSSKVFTFSFIKCRRETHYQIREAFKFRLSHQPSVIRFKIKTKETHLPSKFQQQQPVFLYLATNILPTTIFSVSIVSYYIVVSLSLFRTPLEAVIMNLKWEGGKRRVFGFGKNLLC
jgi:hypothetical protein